MHIVTVLLCSLETTVEYNTVGTALQFMRILAQQYTVQFPKYRYWHYGIDFRFEEKKVT